VPGPLAEDIALMRYLPRGLVILDMAEQLRRPAAEIGSAYFALGRRSGIFAVIRKIEDMRGEAYYEALALKAQRRELGELLRSLVIALKDVKGDADAKLASLGDGARAFSDLSSIPAEDFGPAALMVSIDRIRAVLRKQVER
jgi:NAD-specific glutamate dehydrogenase